MCVSKIVQRPHGHFVLIIMKDYQKHLQRCNYKYNLCQISKDPAAHQKDNVQRLQKYQSTQITDLKYNCAFQQPKISDLDSTWLYCRLNLRALTRFLALAVCGVLRAGLDSLTSRSNSFV